MEPLPTYGWKTRYTAHLENRKTVGAAISSPEWRIHALKLVAIGQTSDPSIVTDGRAMMRIANGLAFAGMPHLIEVL